MATTPSLPLTLEQTAAAIGRKRDWMHTHWPRLVREEGFPPPLHNERPYVWDPVHIQAWKDLRLSKALAKRVAELRGVSDDLVSEQDAIIEEQRQILRKRFEGR